MVLPLLGIAAAGVVTVFLALQAAHLVHWLGIAAGVILAASSFVYLRREQELVGVEWMDTILYAVAAGIVGFTAFKAAQFLLDTAGLVTALVVIGLLVLGGPALVFGVLQDIIGRVV